MNKTELIEAVVAKAGLSKKDADAAVKATFEAITEAMAKGDKVLALVTLRCVKEQQERVRIL